MSKLTRLVIIYGFTWTSVLSGLLFLSKTLLESAERANAESRLSTDWAAMKGYLKIERGRPTWYVDQEDPSENALVMQLKRVVMVTETQGRVLELSPAAGDLHCDHPATLAAAFQQVRQTKAIVLTSERDKSGRTILLLCGELLDESRSQVYYGLIGTPLVGNRLFSRWAFLILPAAILSFALSWLMIRQARKIELPAVGIVS